MDPVGTQHVADDHWWDPVWTQPGPHRPDAGSPGPCFAISSTYILVLCTMQPKRIIPYIVCCIAPLCKWHRYIYVCISTISYTGQWMVEHSLSEVSASHPSGGPARGSRLSQLVHGTGGGPSCYSCASDPGRAARGRPPPLAALLAADEIRRA